MTDKNKTARDRYRAKAYYLNDEARGLVEKALDAIQGVSGKRIPCVELLSEAVILGVPLALEERKARLNMAVARLDTAVRRMKNGGRVGDEVDTEADS